MKIGYMRESAAGPTLAEQQALLRGASVHDADTGEAVQLQPEAIQAMTFLDRGESGAKREQAARMRARKVALGATSGRPERLQGNTRTAAVAAWTDLAKTARAMAPARRAADPDGSCYLGSVRHSAFLNLRLNVSLS